MTVFLLGKGKMVNILHKNILKLLKYIENSLQLSEVRILSRLCLSIYYTSLIRIFLMLMRNKMNYIKFRKLVLCR